MPPSSPPGDVGRRRAFCAPTFLADVRHFTEKYKKLNYFHVIGKITPKIIRIILTVIWQKVVRGDQSSSNKECKIDAVLFRATQRVKEYPGEDRIIFVLDKLCHKKKGVKAVTRGWMMPMSEPIAAKAVLEPQLHLL